jgi:hypothetical protein
VGVRGGAGASMGLIAASPRTLFLEKRGRFRHDSSHPNEYKSFVGDPGKSYPDTKLAVRGRIGPGLAAFFVFRKKTARYGPAKAVPLLQRLSSCGVWSRGRRSARNATADPSTALGMTVLYWGSCYPKSQNRDMGHPRAGGLMGIQRGVAAFFVFWEKRPGTARLKRCPCSKDCRAVAFGVARGDLRERQPQIPRLRSG